MQHKHTSVLKRFGTFLMSGFNLLSQIPSRAKHYPTRMRKWLNMGNYAMKHSSKPKCDDKCVLMVKDLVPHQFTRLTVPYSLLDEEEMHLAGVHLYLDEEKAKK